MRMACAIGVSIMAKLGKPKTKSKATAVTKQPATALTKKPFDVSNMIVSSKEKTFKRPIIVVYGGVGAGKTTFAATASAHYHDKPDTDGLINLKDTLWLAIDAGATDSFITKGYKVPHFDLTDFMCEPDMWSEALKAPWMQNRRFSLEAGPNITDAIHYMSGLVKYCVKHGGITQIVADTVSKLNEKTVSYYMDLYTQSDNKYIVWQKNLALNKNFHEACLYSGAKGVYYLMHSKNVGMTDPEKTGEVKKEKSKKTDCFVVGTATVVPDVAGKAAGVYKRDASLQLVIGATRSLQTKKLVRKAYLLEFEGQEVKNRFEGLLDEVMEPNMQPIKKRIQDCKAKFGVK